MTATVINIERGRLRRALAAGEIGAVLGAVERALSDPVLYDEAVSAFYDVFWVALEDEDLFDRVSDIEVGLVRLEAVS